jgi:hypothetical protein
MRRAAVRAATGVSAEVFDGMHLSVYDGTVLDLGNLAEDKVSVQRVWFREQALFTTSRACPATPTRIPCWRAATSMRTALALDALEMAIPAVADAFDIALTESTIGLFKTELIKACGQVEIATLEYVDWYNHRRSHSGSAALPPADSEALYSEPRLR